MAVAVLPLVAVAMLTLTACDVSRNQPETIEAALPRNVAGAAPMTPNTLAPGMLSPGSLNLHAPEEEGGSTTTIDNTGSERSIRLYGPGVSRKRQTRV